MWSLLLYYTLHIIIIIILFNALDFLFTTSRRDESGFHHYKDEDP